MKITEGLSFDDILVVPSYSEIIPKNVDTRTRFAGNITLNIPILSAAMDTVTEEELAIAIALEGGAGVIHMNLPPEEQAQQVGHVKRYLNWIIDTPVTVEKSEPVKHAIALMEQHKISGLPVVHNGKLAGTIIVSRLFVMKYRQVAQYNMSVPEFCWDQYLQPVLVGQGI